VATDEQNVSPARISFAREGDSGPIAGATVFAPVEHDPDAFNDNDEDEVVTASKKVGKKKGMSPVLVIGIGAGFFLFVLVAIGGLMIIKKRNAAPQDEMQLVDQTPVQPQILAAPVSSQNGAQIMPSVPAVLINPSVASAAGAVSTPVNAGIPVQPAVAAASAGAVQPAINSPVQTPSVQVQTPVPSAVVAASASPAAVNVEQEKSNAALKDVAKAMDNVTREIVSIKQSITAVQARIDRLEAVAKVKPAVATSVPAQSNQLQQKNVQTKPTEQIKSKDNSAVNQTPLSSKAVPVPAKKETILEPALSREMWISGVINNRAFVVRRSPDGTENEQSAVVGEKIDGRRVTNIDVVKKIVDLEDGIRITTTRPR